jgi:hypothetical protein
MEGLVTVKKQSKSEAKTKALELLENNTSLTSSGSSADVGSSNSMTLGFIAKALAIATR